MNRPRIALATLAAGLAALAFAPRVAPAGPKDDYKVVPVANGGTIRGVCKLSEPVKRWMVTVFKDLDKGCKGDHETERVVCGEDGTLGNCVVFLKSIKEGKDWPEAMRSEDRMAKIDQKGCTYLPHVQWIRNETQVAVGNQDGAEHNIHGYRETMSDTQFNFSSPPGSLKDAVDGAFLQKPTLYLVKCDIHPWMSAFVHVTTHPYYDVTSAVADEAAKKKAGEYVLTDVPPGDYEVVCWHEGMEETAQVQDSKISAYTYSPEIRLPEKVHVDAGKESVKDFTIEAPKKRDIK